jgi:hypothetical protein
MNPIIRGNLFALAGACARDWQSNVISQLQNAGISVFNNQNPLFGLFSQSQDISNEVHFTKLYSQTLLGVLLEDYPSEASCQLLIEYLQYFKANTILVIPDYKSKNNPIKGTVDFNHQKQVNTQRVYLRQLAAQYNVHMFDTIEEAVQFGIELHTKWSNTVISLGACGNTTWRSEYFSPLSNLERTFDHYNPQQDNWVPQMAIDEALAKEYANVLFVNLNDLPVQDATLGLVSQDETWYLSSQNRNVIVVYNPLLDQNSIPLLEHVHVEDYLMARQQLITKLELAKSANPFFKWVYTMEEGMSELNKVHNLIGMTAKTFAHC